MRPDKPTLQDLIHEARDERGPNVDWDKVEAKLFPRVEAEARAQAALAKHGGPKRAWVGVGVALAAAAAVPLFLAHGPKGSLDGATAAREPTASALSWSEPGVVARVTHEGVGRDAASGDVLVRGDAVAVHGGRAVFRRADPRGVAWDAEDGTELSVRASGETLILTLAKGAVEAQVTPVPEGEAFAIDVEGTRVAVHGTHLRVERQAGHAIVDLREGVVSIGLPPKAGATYGDLVTAPAHVEFDSADPHGTLKVTHEIQRVRVAQPLDAPPEVPHAVATRLTGPAVGHPLAPAPAPAPPLPVTPPRPSAPPVAAPPAPAAPSVAAVPSPVPLPPTPTRVDPNPEKTILDAVRACVRKHVEHADGVVMTISSRLEIRVGDGGTVEGARFDPPLAPEVQSCAATTIWGTRFSAPGAVSVPIVFTL